MKTVLQREAGHGQWSSSQTRSMCAGGDTAFSVLLWDAQSFYQKRSMSIIPIVGVTFAHFQCSR